jgi:hypothetical protein
MNAQRAHPARYPNLESGGPVAGLPMLDDETCRRILRSYHDTTAAEGETPVPLMILHGLREEITIRPHIELPSAYHMSHYLHEFVSEKTIAMTICGRFYKQIGESLFQGTILYHVDRIGSHLIRGIHSDNGRYHVLDDSAYWNKFPYDFDSGPEEPDMPIGFHPGPDGEEWADDEDET